ncbi:MAG TPA: 3'-5' exonuclease [Nitrospira sp.]
MNISHQLETTEQGHRCTVCGQFWKKQPFLNLGCPGVKVYAWGKWPEHLLTKKQMSDAGFQTGKKLPPPAGLCWREKSPDGKMWLYDKHQGVPKKPLSDEARANLKAAAEKSSAGWYCVRCGHSTGYVDRKGHFHARHHSPPGLCDTCIDHESAADWARELLTGEFLILDTETSGLSAGYNEIVQIAVINQSGETLLDTYINPRHPERLLEKGENGISASDINEITPDMLLDAPIWPDVYARLLEITAERKVVIYNAGFDEGMIAGDCERHSIQHHPLDADCAMRVYARFCGEWSRYYNDYRYQTLTGGHTALSDCLACLDVIRGMAEQKGQSDE